MVCVCAPRWPVVELTSGSRECLLGCRIHTGDPAPQKSTWWGSGASVSHRRCKYSHSLRDRGDCGHRLQGALWRVGGCCTPKGSPLAVTPADSREAGWALLADFYPKSKRHTGQGPLNPHLLAGAVGALDLPPPSRSLQCHEDLSGVSRQRGIKWSWPLNTMKVWARVMLKIKIGEDGVGWEMIRNSRHAQSLCPQPPQPSQYTSQVGRVLWVPLAWGWCSPPPKFLAWTRPSTPSSSSSLHTAGIHTRSSYIVLNTFFSLSPFSHNRSCVLNLLSHLWSRKP